MSWKKFAFLKASNFYCRFGGGSKIVGPLEPMPEPCDIDQEHDYGGNSNPLVSNLLMQVQKLKSEHIKYDQVIKDLKSQIATLNRKLCMYQMKYDRVIKGHFPKKAADAVMAHKLKNRFSKEQIGIFCSEKKRSQAKEYCRADLRFAMEVKQCSPKALAIIRKKLPLPTNKTLIRKYGWVHSIPGVIRPVQELLSLGKGKWEKNENLVMVNFDEMYTKNKCGLDTKLQMVMGPSKSVQCLQVRSLVGKLKWPYFYKPQYPMSKKCLNQLIFELESLGLKVLLSVCDQGGDNEGLQKSLKITTENNVFPNPFDPERNVIFAFDWWHGLKRLRAHTLDNNLVFKNGKRASKLDFEAVKRKINSTVTCGFKLTDMVLHCVQSDRQNVDSAIALFNKSIAVMLRQWFPKDEDKMYLAEFIDLGAKYLVFVSRSR